MAAFDTPWLDLMSLATAPARDDEGAPAHDPNPPTFAAFSPVAFSHAPSAGKQQQRSTILVHQKSPLLLATPPQITRALAYSHPFLLPLNNAAALLTWTSGDPWESFLLLASFWAVVLYGDVLMRMAGPLVVVLGLIFGMYARRYSPLSSRGWTGGEAQKRGHRRVDSESTGTRHQKTLDEIVETLKVFTSRCNILLDPLLQLTDFLSTQRTATSATTRPALMALFVRILLVTPVWVLLTLPPLRIITTKRIVLVTGTIILTWHSQPARVTRAILWRSVSVRQICTILTGLSLDATPSSAVLQDTDGKPASTGDQGGRKGGASLADSMVSKRSRDSPGVRFTFILYENQRRWIGLGWTNSLLAYERAAWTDEQLNPAPPKEEFELPDVEGGNARWRWVEGSQWLVEGTGESDDGLSRDKKDKTEGGEGWIYYDNKWQNGRRGQDGWGKYTRRRKWHRDAELVEVTPSTEGTPPSTPSAESMQSPSLADAGSPSSPKTPVEPPPPKHAEHSDSASTGSSSLRRRALRRVGAGAGRRGSLASDRDLEDDALSAHLSILERDRDWAISDDLRMSLE